MSFETITYLSKATSRAKSDVANKLVSMFLHELSRRISASVKLYVTDRSYAEAVAATFENRCAYCDRSMEADRASVEHLDGMNRFQVGLHIPGNVVVACKRCNGEKRRDDQVIENLLASSGWESFLSHDSTRCPSKCKSCAYWREIWPDEKQRPAKMRSALLRIISFRDSYPESVAYNDKAKLILREPLGTLYKECQRFATDQISKSVDEIIEKFHKP